MYTAKLYVWIHTGVHLLIDIYSNTKLTFHKTRPRQYYIRTAININTDSGVLTVLDFPIVIKSCSIESRKDPSPKSEVVHEIKFSLKFNSTHVC